jgi:hypothetical protein
LHRNADPSWAVSRQFSEGRDFNPQTFVNWYADMAEPARGMLFKPELRKSLDGFVAMNQQLSRVKGAQQHIEHFAGPRRSGNCCNSLMT